MQPGPSPTWNARARLPRTTPDLTSRWGWPSASVPAGPIPSARSRRPSGWTHAPSPDTTTSASRWNVLADCAKRIKRSTLRSNWNPHTQRLVQPTIASGVVCSNTDLSGSIPFGLIQIHGKNSRGPSSNLLLDPHQPASQLLRRHRPTQRRPRIVKLFSCSPQPQWLRLPDRPAPAAGRACPQTVGSALAVDTRRPSIRT